MKIKLYGELVSDDWAWVYEFFEIPCCYPAIVRDAIAALPPDDELVLEINCPGGDVWAGFEIFGMLQGCRAHTEAHVIAMAASAATTVMSGCDTVLASPVAQVMIHQPATGAGYVNNDGARELVNFLDSIKASIINGYVVKAAGKTPRARFEQLVDESTWMPVQDAIDLGLVDGMLDTDEETAQRIAAAGGLLITNMATLSTPPKTLLERYEAAVRAGNAEEVPGHPVEPTPSTAEAAPLPQTPHARLGEASSMATTPATAPENAADTDVGNNWQLQAAIDLERARCVL